MKYEFGLDSQWWQILCAHHCYR